MDTNTMSVPHKLVRTTDILP